MIDIMKYLLTFVCGCLCGFVLFGFNEVNDELKQLQMYTEMQQYSLDQLRHEIADIQQEMIKK
ncbi:hypothetical protein PTW35_24825 (plasmid) [Photobacterium sp. DA100]|uniref:hypothetical protein n=1 Tax=Photobacterium sp. DA100 TaxID=3027472 RepID=UPI002479AFEC|nr:hypothetical protein [Photobacterium sp. DA100]WEM44498.1 hypothetical protein PTW35_24825 [Photobacterium sp. DA100]